MADNRENTLLQAIADGETVDDARTSDEVFLKAIADGAEKPEEIRNRLQYWLNQIGGGGGNPNTVEEIDGTVENPWGNYSPQEIMSMLDSQDYTLFIYGLPLGRALVHRLNSGLVAVNSAYKEPDRFGEDSVMISYTDTLTLLSSEIYESTWRPFSVNNPCTLTIIHHPLPTT